MVKCETCDLNVISKVRICKICFNKMLDSIALLTPLSVKEKNLRCQDVFPDPLFLQMDSELIKDLDEALGCLGGAFWNATAMICARILERELKLHIEKDLNIYEDPKSLRKCLKILKARDYYEPTFYETLEQLIDLRNRIVHGGERIQMGEHLLMFRNVFGFVGWIYNKIS